MRVLALGVAVALGVTTTNATALAQNPSVLLSEGVTAYDDVEFEIAARLLRRALDPDAGTSLSANERDRAMMYLGAAELFHGQRDSSIASFERLILANPRYRADELIFPPRVTRAFNGVREIHKATAVNVARVQTLVVGRDQLTIRVFASSAHRITAAVTDERGRARRVLYTGGIEDSLSISWDGLDSAGGPLATGQYRLDVVSRNPQDAVLRTQRIPLRITRRRAEARSIPPPPEPVYRTRKGGPVAGLKFLIPGVAIGAAVMLPAAVGNADAKTARYTIGGAVTIGGILGFLSQAGGTRKVEDRVATDSVQAEWRRRVATIQRANRRRGTPRLEIRAGQPQRIEGGR